MGDFTPLSPNLDDGDVTVYQGDALTVLQSLPAASVHCCVTSPPYWGLRDYGTGSWEGGDHGCDHTPKAAPRATREAAGLTGGKATVDAGTIQRGVCHCGASRVDMQLGLEATPAKYVAALVQVMGEVRRVLRQDGTVWLNLGDSYNGSGSPGGAGKQDTNVGSFGTAAKNVAELKLKDLVGIPWRVAFALQADGWYLRSDIVWSKPNPMPESVTDRPTKAHEYVFLLSKSPRYFFDQEAVREPYLGGHTWDAFRGGHSEPSAYTEQNGPQPNSSRGPDGRRATRVVGAEGSEQHRDGERWPNLNGRNIRSVWEIATQPFPEAHFATYPEELVRRCILAGCPEGGTVLDPFLGSGTTALVARKHGRRCVGVELNPEYCAIAARRLQQLSLLTGAVVSGG